MSHINVFIGLFIASIIYAFALNWVERHWPEVFDNHTWITVVIGCGYTIIGLAFILDEGTILLIFYAFVASGLPIVARSLIDEIVKKRDLNHMLNEEFDKNGERISGPAGRRATDR